MTITSKPYLIHYISTLISIILCLNFTAIAQARQNTIDFKVIKDYALFAKVAYQTKHEIYNVGLQKSYQPTFYHNIPEFDIAYYLLTNDVTKTQIIAVRGTSNIENAMLDIALKLMPDRHTGIYLHEGFAKAAQAIYANIRPLIKPDYVINTTGHSMGGAIALILAMHLNIDHYKIDQIITFGQPKVTNTSGSYKFQNLNVTRIVTEKDLVPLVPPFDPSNMNLQNIYWHLGQEIILLSGNTYSILEGMNSMLRATKFTETMLDENNLTDHDMNLYLNLILQKTNSQRLVPYENSFNLFNLFSNQ